MSPAEGRVADAACAGLRFRRPAGRDAEKDGVSRGGVTPGSRPRARHPKAWTRRSSRRPPRRSTRPRRSASSSRDRAERVSGEKHAHMEAGAELLSLIAEAAADANVLGEAFSEGGRRSGSGRPVRVALLAAARRARDQGRRDRERRGGGPRDAEHCGTCAGSGGNRRCAPARARMDRPRSPPRKTATSSRGTGEKENETETRRSLDATRRLERRARPRRSRRKPRAEPRCRRSSPRARRGGASSSRGKTAARLREPWLEILKKSSAAAGKQRGARRRARDRYRENERGPGWDTPRRKPRTRPRAPPPTPVRVVDAVLPRSPGGGGSRARRAAGEAPGGSASPSTLRAWAYLPLLLLFPRLRVPTASAPSRRETRESPRRRGRARRRAPRQI